MDSRDISLPIFEQTCLNYLWSEVILDDSKVPSQQLYLQDDQFRHAHISLAEREGVLFKIFAQSKGSHDITFKYCTYCKTQKKREIMCSVCEDNSYTFSC